MQVWSTPFVYKGGGLQTMCVCVSVKFTVTLHEKVRYRGTLQY